MDETENWGNEDFAQLTDSNEGQKYIWCFKNDSIYLTGLEGLGY